jgi:hypothetical protein
MKNVVTHFLYYLLLKLSGGKLSQCNSYMVYDILGEKIITFSDSMGIDIKISSAAIADAYISNLGTPYVVDIECIESGVNLFKNEKTIDEIITAMEKYHYNKIFADAKYLSGFNRFIARFDDEFFRNLMQYFYFHLAF